MPKRYKKRKIAFISLLAAAFLVASLMFWQRIVITQKEATTSNQSVQNNSSNFDKDKYSLSKPDSLWVVVNKQRGISESYTPSNLIVPDVALRLDSTEQQMQLSKRAEKDLEQMFATAKQDDVRLIFGSGYRSAALQRQFYDSYVAADGQAAADRYSARPGHSEHQTGLGIDITSPSGNCHLEICWANTPEGRWVQANSYKYGFTLRYQKDKDAITGYQYEPWHLRYVGKSLAGQVKNNITLEEFFGLPPAPNY